MSFSVVRLLFPSYSHTPHVHTHTHHTHTTHTPHTHTLTRQLILAATEQFNKKPSHGVAFLVEQGILPSPPPPEKLAEFLLQNPALSKAMIGDYIGDRKNAEVLEAFVK